MSCAFCKHGKDKGGRDLFSVFKPGSYDQLEDNKTGFCTIAPEWVPVSPFHYCSKLEMENPHLPGMWYRMLHKCGQEKRILKDELKAATARKKKLNAKIRQLKAHD